MPHGQMPCKNPACDKIVGPATKVCKHCKFVYPKKDKVKLKASDPVTAKQVVKHVARTIDEAIRANASNSVNPSMRADVRDLGETVDKLVLEQKNLYRLIDELRDRFGDHVMNRPGKPDGYWNRLATATVPPKPTVNEAAFLERMKDVPSPQPIEGWDVVDTSVPDDELPTANPVPDDVNVLGPQVADSAPWDDDFGSVTINA